MTLREKGLNLQFDFRWGETGPKTLRDSSSLNQHKIQNEQINKNKTKNKRNIKVARN